MSQIDCQSIYGSGRKALVARHAKVVSSTLLLWWILPEISRSRAFFFLLKTHELSAILHSAVTGYGGEALYSCCICFSPSRLSVTKTSHNTRLFIRMGIS